MEQSDLKLRLDRFLERFLLCSPFPKKIMYKEVISASDNVQSNYSPDAQSSEKLLEQIFNYHVFKSRQCRYFFRVFLRAPLANMPDTVFFMITIYKINAKKE